MNALKELEIGEVAPLFNLPCSDGTDISLKSLKGHKVIVYFYPKDNTPGCTLEAKDFSDHMATFKKYDCVVIGISRDSIESHCNFINKHKLNLILASDRDGAICKKYRILTKTISYGKKSIRISRSTFLIDTFGKIMHIWKGVRVENHITEILEKLNG